jgi:hypothetical protein
VNEDQPRRDGIGARVALIASLFDRLGSSGRGVPGGDPGDKRLRELATDPVFKRVPADAADAELRENPASYEKPGFTGGGWTGPVVTLAFVTSGDSRSVYEFYEREARLANWTAIRTSEQSLPVAWVKDYPTGSRATLVLHDFELGSSLPEAGDYRLIGSILPPRNA